MTPIKENRDWEEEFDDLFEPIDGSLFQNYPATIMIMKKFIGSVLASHEAKVKEELTKLNHFKDTTIGLYATDRPDLLEDPKNILFKITYEKD